MALVVLEDDNIKVKAPVGTTMRTIALKSGASMEFGCRVGDCATCIGRVTKGVEFLNAKNDKEIKALAMIDANSPNLRLMCQCEVISDDGEIVISYDRHRGAAC